MGYPPTFIGFLKAVFDTVRGKKLRPRIPMDESARDIDDYEIYDPNKDPGMEFWHREAENLAERRGQEKADAEKVMIQDYELEHAEEASTEIDEGNEETTQESSLNEEVAATGDKSEAGGADDFGSADFEAGDF